LELRVLAWTAGRYFEAGVVLSEAVKDEILRSDSELVIRAKRAMVNAAPSKCSALFGRVLYDISFSAMKPEEFAHIIRFGFIRESHYAFLNADIE
jgi:hypothetical protein